MNNNSPPIRRISFLPHFEPIFQEIYWPFGEMLLLKTNNEKVIEAAEEAFGRFPEGDDSSMIPLIITILVKEADRQTRTTRRPNPVYSTQAHHFYISLDKDNVAVADINDGYASGFLTQDVIEDQAYFRYYFLEALTQAMLAPTRHFISIHAACVQKCGVSLILQGKSGSGKSTLAYACLRNGYQLLAEDVVHVKFHNNEASLRGAPWKFHLLPDTIQFFPEFENAQPSLQLNGEWKLEIEIEDHYPNSTITSARPGPIVLVTRNPHRTAALELLPLMTAIHEFEVVWPWEVGWSVKHEIVSKSLLMNGVYRLYTGGNIFDSIYLLDELVKQVAESANRDLPYETYSYPKMPGTSSHLT